MKFQNTVFLAALFGSLVLVNLLGLRFFARADVTNTKAYTLAKATRDTLGALEDQVTISAYFTENLPAPYAGNAKLVRDLLDEYRAASKGKVAFEFIDPAAQESVADKDAKREVKRDIFGNRFREQTSVERELTQAGLQQVNVRAVSDDQEQVIRAWMGIVIKHQEKKEVIPVVQTVQGLEYELTMLIRKMTRTRTPVVGILSGHGEVPMEKLTLLQQALAESWQLKPVTLAPGKDRFDGDLDALWVIGPKTALPPAEVKALDQFLMEGKSVALFLDSQHVDLRSFNSEPAAHGLGEWLSTYGLTVGEKLVADVSSATINVSERRGNFTVQMPVPYPFLPVVKRMEGESAIGQGLSEVLFPFAAEVGVKPVDGVQAVVLARSSKKSWLEANPPNIDPRREWGTEAPTFDGPHPLLVQVSGKLKSHYSAEAAQSGGGSPVLGEAKGEARLVLAGTSGLLQDDYLGNSRSNQVLVMNIGDWMMLDPALLAMRTRGLQLAALQTDLSEGTRLAAKWGNALGLPLALTMLGLVLWRLRERRRATVAI